MKMNKEQEMEMKNKMGMESEDESKEGDVGEATPAHEAAESGTKEHEEDMAEDDSEESDWKANCDANDLLRAAEIKADPMRMKAALEILGQKKKAIDSMEELMAVRKDKMLEKKS